MSDYHINIFYAEPSLNPSTALLFIKLASEQEAASLIRYLALREDA